MTGTTQNSNIKTSASSQSFKEKMYGKHIGSKLLKFLVWAAAAITMLVLVFLIGYIILKGIPNLKPSLFEWEYNSENVSMTPAILNTLEMTVLTLLIAVPIGIFSAVYMVEYAKKGSKLVKIIRLTSETLQGIPSIVFGLFGYIFFVLALRWRFSMIAGVCTLAIMILPLIMRTTEEALLSVPDSYREGSFGLGAGKLRTVFKIVLPTAIPGIFAGVILAIGRIVGETAALIYTSGSGSSFTGDITNSSRTLAVHLYCLYSEGLYTNEAYATAFVLLIFVVGINMLSSFIAKRLTRSKEK